jgi:hypothetical protein
MHLNQPPPPSPSNDLKKLISLNRAKQELLNLKPEKFNYTLRKTPKSRFVGINETDFKALKIYTKGILTAMLGVTNFNYKKDNLRHWNDFLGLETPPTNLQSFLQNNNYRLINEFFFFALVNTLELEVNETEEKV